MTEQWWKTVYTKGIRQETDPQGLGYFSAAPKPQPGDFDICDRTVNPAIITKREAFEGDGQLASRGSYEGPGYYLIGPDGVCRRIWAPGDVTQRPGEDFEPWQYRIGKMEPREDPKPDPSSGGFPSRPAESAHASRADVRTIMEALALIRDEIKLLQPR